MEGWEHACALYCDGVTVALEGTATAGSWRLCGLTNTWSVPATVVVRLQGGQESHFRLLPFQKRQVYPALLLDSDVTSAVDVAEAPL